MISGAINAVGFILSRVYTKRVSQKISHILNVFYSAWVKKILSNVGEDFYVNRPIYIHGGKSISIGKHFHTDKRLRLESFGSASLTIGNNVRITWDCHIGALESVTIGDNVLIGSKTIITDHFHGEIDEFNLSIPPSERKLFFKGPVVIEKNVWIGEAVAIMPGVRVGENSIIGANAVVTRDIPKNSVVAGNPARVIKSFDV
jgi:acetyltransferase-like isoleucine patch superfamily enzyme